MAIEIVGGLLARSLAIMTDVAHLFSDITGFLISIVSILISSKLKANKTMSYGYHRAEIIGTMASILLIWGLTIWLFSESILRIQEPKSVNPNYMFFVALLGLGFNIVMMKILHSSPTFGCSSHNHSHSHPAEITQPKPPTKSPNRSFLDKPQSKDASFIGAPDKPVLPQSQGNTYLIIILFRRQGD
jgi:zinc transporter 2